MTLATEWTAPAGTGLHRLVCEAAEANAHTIQVADELGRCTYRLQVGGRLSARKVCASPTMLVNELVRADEDEAEAFLYALGDRDFNHASLSAVIVGTVRMFSLVHRPRSNPTILVVQRVPLNLKPYPG